MDDQADRLVSREDLPEWLRRCVDAFGAQYSPLGEAFIARGKCWRASITFLQFVCDRVSDDCEAFMGVADVTSHPHYADGVRALGGERGRHYVTQVGEYAIDWTARQFRHDDDFPRIWVPPEPLAFYA